jgi:hypothetical protein
MLQQGISVRRVTVSRQAIIYHRSGYQSLHLLSYIRSLRIFISVLTTVGTAVTQVLRYKSEGRWFDPRLCRGMFRWIKSFWSHYGPGADSASNINEYQVYFLGGKCGRCVRLTTLPPSCAVGNLNFLEHSGPHQACNGTDLPLLTTADSLQFYTHIFIVAKYAMFWPPVSCCSHSSVTTWQGRVKLEQATDGLQSAVRLPKHESEILREPKQWYSFLLFHCSTFYRQTWPLVCTIQFDIWSFVGDSSILMSCNSVNRHRRLWGSFSVSLLLYRKNLLLLFKL